MEGQIGGGDVLLLDIGEYDCVAYNYPAVDLASHFQWFAGNGPAFNSDYLPDEEQRRSFIQDYLRGYLGKASDGDIPTTEVDAMHEEVQRWSLVTWLYIAGWQIAKACSAPSRFDTLMSSAEFRIDRYRKLRSDSLTC